MRDGILHDRRGVTITMAQRGGSSSGAVLPPPPAVPIRSPPADVAGEVEVRVVPAKGGPAVEARVCAPAGAARLVLLCHPHPLYGGSMHSPVPLAIARRLAEAADPRLAWARFNFRGVGASEGTYDEGRGEVDDARAVLDQARALVPNARLTVCGHSFGSWVAFQTAGVEPDIERALLVAPSPRFFGFEERPRPPSLASLTVFVGDGDEFCSVDDARALADRFRADLRVFEGHDHHFLKSRRAMAQAALLVLAPEVAGP